MAGLMAEVYKASVQPLWSIHQPPAVTGVNSVIKETLVSCSPCASAKIGLRQLCASFPKADLAATATVPLSFYHGNQQQQRLTILGQHRTLTVFFGPAGSEQDRFPWWVTFHYRQQRPKHQRIKAILLCFVLML